MITKEIQESSRELDKREKVKLVMSNIRAMEVGEIFTVRDYVKLICLSDVPLQDGTVEFTQMVLINEDGEMVAINSPIAIRYATQIYDLMVDGDDCEAFDVVLKECESTEKGHQNFKIIELL